MLPCCPPDAEVKEVGGEYEGIKDIDTGDDDAADDEDDDEANDEGGGDEGV